MNVQLEMVQAPLMLTLAMTRDANPPTGWLAGLWRLVESQILAIQGRTDEGSQLLTEAERLLVDNGAWWGVWATASLVQLAQLRRDLDSVCATAKRALSVCEQRDIPELEVELRGLLAMIEATAGDHDAAVHLDRAQQLAATHHRPRRSTRHGTRTAGTARLRTLRERTSDRVRAHG